MSGEEMDAVVWCDATELARRIRARQLGARDCLEVFLDRVAQFDADIGAIVVLDADRAREAATAADRELAEGRVRGPLHGVPMTIKEAFDVAGLPTTFGSPEFAYGRAQVDADVTRKLRDAGAIVFAKTNVPLGLEDFQSYNDVYGTTSNPWDLSRSPGGSSGGESAALAAGMTPLGFGSDIGGSLRNPAHYTGTFAHKPTFGIVPHVGHSPTPRWSRDDLNVLGPMARSARDLRLALDVTAGPTLGHGVGWKLELPRVTKALSQLRVAVWAEDPKAPVESEISRRCVELGECLAEQGAKVSFRARPDFEPDRAHSTYVKLLTAALSIGQAPSDFHEILRQASRFDPEDPASEATHAWNRVMPHRRWLRADEERERVRAAWGRFFEEWDLVVAPIGSTAAFPHDHRPFGERRLVVDGVSRGYFEQLFWAGLATGPYLPSTAIPTGLNGQGLPIGVQLIGAAYQDHLLIDVAEQLESLGYCFRAPPGYA